MPDERHPPFGHEAGSVDLTNVDHPIELDCQHCKKHHVLDPRALKRFLKRRKFKCVVCGQRWPIRGLAAFVMVDHEPRGACLACEMGR